MCSSDLIKYGTIVFYEGFQIGQVTKVEPQQQGQQISFKVDMEVKRGWKIPEDSIARSMVSGLLAAVAIDIRAGHSAALLKPGAQIKGQEAGNFFSTLADIGAQFGDLSTNSIRPLLENLTGRDPFCVLADFADYLRVQEQVSRAWADRSAWNRMSLLNTARTGFFSSDRSIREYADRIWKAEAFPVTITCNLDD